jgi:outer membrane receptor protein involved in Fe transport
MYGPGGTFEDPFVANPVSSIAGPINYAGSRTKWDHAKYEKYSGNLDLSYYVSLTGEHAWKAGFQIVQDREDRLDGGAYPQVDINWNDTCSALEDYGTPPLRGQYGFYTVVAGWNSPYGWAWKIHRNSYAVYLQDSWTIGGKLTINAGVRTESEYIPSFTENVPEEYKKPIKFGFDKKIAPRFGAVYDVFGDSA